VLLRKARENQDRQVGCPGLDRGERIDAALVRHRKVHHQDVDLALPDDVHGFSPVRRFRHHGQVDLLRKKLAQASPNDGVVVDDGDSDHDGTRLDGRSVSGVAQV
jgi:hypothetical protein